MGKTIFVLTDNDRNPISDSISVTLTKTTSPYTIYTGTKIPSIGNNNGTRVFADVTDGDYTVKFDGNIQSDLSSLHVAGPGTIINSTIGNGEVNTIHLVNGLITTIKIADLNVTTEKIANLAVTSSKIAAGAVDGTSLADSSIVKSKLASGVFASSMEDVSGWGPKVDGVTIDKTSGFLFIPNTGVGTDQIADSAVTKIKIAIGTISSDEMAINAIITEKIATAAVTTDKIADDAIISNKLANDSVTIGKVFNGSISTEKIADGAVTEGKLGTGSITGSKIADSAIDINNLEISLKNSMVRFPTDVAFVSPEFSDNVAPYFDNISDAYAYIDDNKGTIYIYPGTYTTPILMGEAVNLIGLDKTRCILNIMADSDEPYGIKIIATSKQFLMKNLTLKVTTSAPIGTTLYGLWIDGVGSDFVRIEDCLIFVKPASHQTITDFCTAIYINGANFRIERSFIQAHSANYGSSWAGSGVIAIRLAGTTIGVINDCQFSIRALCSGSIVVYGISWTSSSQDVDVSSCVLEVTDSGTSSNVYTFAADAAITLLAMNSLFSKNAHSNVTLVTGVGAVQNGNVKVKDGIS